MLVKDIMTRHPLLAEPDWSIVEAQRYMSEASLRHLPVVGDGKRLLGLLTRESLMLDSARLGNIDVWEITRYLSGIAVSEVMVPGKDVITTSPDVPIEDAARVLVENRIGSLPVIEDGRVVGIITEDDLLRQLTRMLSVDVPGVRVTIRMPNKRGELAKLVAAVAAQGWGFAALGGVPSEEEPGMWDAVVKLRRPREEVLPALEAIEGQRVIDVREM